MLILTGLSTLLVGISAVTSWAAPSSPTFAPVGSRAPISRGRNPIPRILSSTEVQDHDRNGRLPASVPAQLTSLLRRKRDRRWTALFSRDDGCSQESTTVCSGRNGTGHACSGCSTCCPAANGGFQCCQQGFRCCVTSTGAGSCCPDDGSSCAEGGCGSSPGTPSGGVFETVTLTRTITSFTASRTVVAISTVVETLTIIDPTKRTQTATITATSQLNRAARSADVLYVETTPTPQAVAASKPQSIIPGVTSSTSGNEALKRQAAQPAGTLTITVTVAATTTIFVSELTSTITNTIFVTTTVAPLAITTVFTTTTIVVPPSAGTTVTETRTPTTFLSPNPPGSTGTIIPPPGTSGAPSTSPASGSASSTLIPTSSTPAPPAPTSSTTLIAPSPTSSPPPPSSTIPTTTSTPPSSTTSATIETMLTSSTTPQPPPTSTPSTPPTSSSTPTLSPEQIAGVVVGVFIFLLLLVLLAFALRWLIRRRRSRLAAARQQLTPPGPTGAPGGGDTTSVSASGLTGENEVRIVIRPAPSRRRNGRGLWPMPPGHGGQTYSFFVEDTTTGESTPQRAGGGEGDPRRWSIASERGSPGATQSGTGTQSGSEAGRGTAGLVSVGWGNTAGAGGLLSPSAGWRGQQGQGGGGGGGGAGPSGSGNGGDAGRGGYPQGSLGIGKAF